MNLDQIFIVIQIITIVFIVIPTIYAVFWGSPFIPTQKRAIDDILKKIQIKKGMHVYDLGSGDGRFLTSISKKVPIHGIGFEYSPPVYLWACIRNTILRGKNVRFLYKDYLKHNLNNADIIFCFLLPQRMNRVEKKLLKECKKGTQIICHGFPMKNLEPRDIIEKTVHVPFSTYFYIL